MSWWYEKPEDLQKLLQPIIDLEKQLIKPFVNQKGYIEHYNKNGDLVSGLPEDIAQACIELGKQRWAIIDRYDSLHTRAVCIKCGQAILASQNGKCMNIARCPLAPRYIGG